MSTLKQKILDRSVTLGVVGLGYVGLPLAVEKAKAGFFVIGFDVQKEKVDMVNQGHNYIGDVVNHDLEEIVKSGHLRATMDFAAVASCDCVCIAVPTPLDEHQQPDISYVRSSAESIMPYVHKDMLIVLESTTYPGTTEFLIVPYFGACIHTPPPPANQIIHAKSRKPLSNVKMMTPLWVYGTFSVQRASTDWGVAGYRLEVERIAPYDLPGNDKPGR